MAFGRVGLLGFGGGPAFIPLLQREVEAAGWMSREDFVDALAFGNALPGPIATKMAGHVGHRVAGVAGVVVANLALIVPTVVMMLALASAYLLYRDHPAVAATLTGIRPVVIALLLATVLQFLPAAWGRARDWRANWPTYPLAVVAFAAAAWGGVHPAILIVVGGAVGMALRGRA
jgi:chromate transporter